MTFKRAKINKKTKQIYFVFIYTYIFFFFRVHLLTVTRDRYLLNWKLFNVQIRSRAFSTCGFRSLEFDFESRKIL